MGSRWVIEALRDLDQGWKDRFIESWISVAGVFGGAPKASRFLISGGKEGIPFLDRRSMRKVFYTWESLFWISPNPELYDNKVLI